MGAIKTYLIQLFSPPADPALLTYGSYDPWLVLLSLLVASFSSAMALQMAGLAAGGTRPGLRLVALATGSLALGSGVWAMHFIGMLAFTLCTQVSYDPTTTLLSMLPSIAASSVALSLLSRKRIGLRSLLLGGAMVGAGIAAMHYTGMAAMRSALQLRYDPWIFGLSILVAMALATLALWVRFGLQGLRGRLGHTATVATAGVIMGCAIAGMHYTGMAAARFVGRMPLEPDSGIANAAFLALAVGMTTGLLTALVVSANGMLRYRALFHQVSGLELALRTSEEQLRSLVANIPGITFRCRNVPGWPLLFVSDAIESMTGYPAADFLGDPPRRLFGELVHPDDWPAVQQGARSAVMERRPFRLEYRIRHRDGSIHWFWGNGNVVPGPSGEVELIDGVVLDISGRRLMEQDLRIAKERAEQAAAARAAFLANMSHEIRTPMNSILGFTDVLLNGELTPVQRRHLDTVRNAGRSLLRLLDAILDTAKLDKGAVELELHDFSLLALSDELASTMATAARAKGLSMSLQYDPALPNWIHGDELRVRQVLTNLMDNALKFTSRGSVSLAVSPEIEGERRMVHFAVSDTGIGIEPERMQAIFEPFVQADASMNRRFGGTGLGTTICKQLVELMGGRLWADSVPGQGSTFHVLLPLLPARAQAARSAAAPTLLPPLHILAADDVPQNVEVLQLLLAKLGHTVTGASDGAVAARLAAEAQFDAILMDVQMPGTDGLAATRRIRAAEDAAGRPRVPVIAMTANVLARDREAARAAGMDGFTAKPVDVAVLTQELARVLDMPAGAPQLAPSPFPVRGMVLNVDKGLQRWTGQHAPYLRALRRFAGDHEDAAQELASALAAGQHAAGAALAHRMRGAAANLGLEQLADALWRLENGLQEADGRAVLPQLLEQAAQRLSEALAAIQEHWDSRQAAPAGADAAPPDLAQACALGTAMLRSLERGSFDPRELAQLAAAAGSAVSGERLAALQEALDDFDATAARHALQALLDECRDLQRNAQ
ncbi:MHYT domain-containing protein [Pseudoduganella violaceinigra]|uniref:MHYT domain-containing protein n=1 Tax=Pseudoduganella violaceinigra TaxID=246602 RepID=UPI00041AE21D|nr:MHYT domain-containing protein [Pseudoduganella violaceinigra]